MGEGIRKRGTAHRAETASSQGSLLRWNLGLWQDALFLRASILTVMERQTEAGFPCSSLSYSGIMNLSSVFSHTHDSRALAEDEMLP